MKNFHERIHQIRQDQRNRGNWVHWLRGTGRSTGQAFEIVGWCLQNPENPCFIGGEPPRNLDERHFLHVHDHADTRMQPRNQASERLFITVKELVERNELEGFWFDDTHWVVRYSLSAPDKKPVVTRRPEKRGRR